MLSSDAWGKSKFWFQGGKLTVESSSGRESRALLGANYLPYSPTEYSVLPHPLALRKGLAGA